MRWPWVLAAVAAILTSVAARAFELERVDQNPCGVSRNLAWASHSAAVNTLTLPPALQSVGAQARSRWNASVPSFFFYGGIGAPCGLGDSVASLTFGPTACDGSAFGAGVLALTVIHWNVATGEMLGADTVFNAHQPRLTTDPALFLEVAMHELGHVLGLDHSDACGASGAGTLMQSVIALGAPRRDAPQADDIAGANFIYAGAAVPTAPPTGTDGTAPEEATGCAIVPGDGPHRWPVPGAGVVGLVGWRLAWRWRRRFARAQPDRAAVAHRHCWKGS